MKWHTSIFKMVFKGIVLFLLPITILFFVLGKAIVIVHNLILPIKQYLPAERILGLGVLPLISVILLLVICYFAGIISEKKQIKSFIHFLEDNLLVFIPGYALMKSRASETIGSNDAKWSTVLVGEQDDWKLGIEVDKQLDGYSTIFFPEPPDAKSGELKLIHESKFKRHTMSVSKLVNIIRQYGQGSAALAK